MSTQEVADKELVIGFKLAKKTDDCQGIELFLTRVADAPDDAECQVF